MTQTASRAKSLHTWQYIWQLIRFRPWHYLALGVLEVLFFGVFPQLVALVTYAFFNTLTGDASANIGVNGLIALLVVIAVARVAAIFADVVVYFSFMYTLAALLRKNLFEHTLRRPGARAVPGSPGEAISRFRGDVDEIASFMAESLILLGFGLFSLIAVVVMLRINVRITLIVFIPLVVVIVAANLAMKNIEKYRQANRTATGDVTGFIGEVFGSAQAVKVAVAETHILERFNALNETRRKAALQDRLFNELLGSVFRNAVNIGTGLILLLAAQQMNAVGGASSFTVADFALFVYYLGFVTEFTGLIGVRWAWYKQVGVSFQRLETLMEDAPPQTLVRHGSVYMHGALPTVPYVAKTEAHVLRELRAEGLTYKYRDTGRGVEGVDLFLHRGSFTVITGRVGSGKTTLLKALLGLLPKDKGTILWNDELVEDPDAFFVPPRSAYTAQVPLLFSESLKDNILMGVPDDKADLPGAIRSAVMEQDLAELEYGLNTMLGAKGVRISGGQRQRAAAARMFVREPELLVFDDLSSALDVETEKMLWERVFDRSDATCLVVSHRKEALRRADHIVILRDGQVEAEGQLDELLGSCEEMQRLWHGDLAPTKPECTPPRRLIPGTTAEYDPVLEKALDQVFEQALDQRFEDALDQALEKTHT